MQSSEFDQESIRGLRRKMAKELQIPWINVGRAILIMLYWVFTTILTSLSGDLDKGATNTVYHSLESIFIVLFILEILLFKFAFKGKYFENKFNVINLILVILIFLFWILDIFISNYTISVILRIRGSLRLAYIPIIVEHIKSNIKKKRGKEYQMGKY